MAQEKLCPLSLDLRSRTPVYEQIKQGIKELIRIGYYEVDDRLPPIRTLAAELSVNFNTVKRSFKELEAEKVIYSVQGRGSYIMQVDAVKTAAAEKAEAQLIEAMRAAKLNGMSAERAKNLLNKIFEGGEENA